MSKLKTSNMGGLGLANPIKPTVPAKNSKQSTTTTTAAACTSHQAILSINVNQKIADNGRKRRTALESISSNVTSQSSNQIKLNSNHKNKNDNCEKFRFDSYVAYGGSNQNLDKPEKQSSLQQQPNKKPSLLKKSDSVVSSSNGIKKSTTESKRFNILKI
jgi:hypothetical protein